MTMVAIMLKILTTMMITATTVAISSDVYLLWFSTFAC